MSELRARILAAIAGGDPYALHRDPRNTVWLGQHGGGRDVTEEVKAMGRDGLLVLDPDTERYVLTAA
ncbi:hypothetical protein E1091_02340 [Micromonospora fluostatini]|uniref:Uncharacterized protein n=1 Tax=Micromonospora fluostatini TaxID=1629071 RepID=A0ABY2DKZ1_9ACTN|nr:hypothetical protein E1091_02340 [Micromonospora fluostatini]